MEEAIKIAALLMLPATLWITNRWRGLGEDRPKFLFTKTMVYILETLIFLSFLYLVAARNPLLIAGVYFITRWLCTSFGWGKYFPHGGQNYEEKEFFPVDWIMAKFMPWTTRMPINWVKKWKTIAMTLRFLLTFGVTQVPMIAYLANSWLVLGCGIALYGCCGLAYRLAFDKYKGNPNALGRAENYSGALIGSFLAIIILVL